MINLIQPAMRIAIDARMMSPKATRGIGRYIEELIRSMLEISPEDKYFLITRQSIHPFSSHPSVTTIVADIPWYGFREQWRMPGILKSLKADVVHIPHWNVPFFYSGPLVLTLHDLLLCHEPTSARISTRSPLIAAIKRFAFRMNLNAALRHAKIILVPTQFVADDLKKLFPKITARIVVTGEGMMRHRNYPLNTTRQPALSNYLLYVGSAYPHKGLDLLIDAWEELEQQYLDLRLKIAGPDDEFMQRLKDSVRKRKLSRIDFLDYVNDEALARLYRDATAFVFPSRFEGFGLPPLEALQHGCPVIAADAVAVREVLGEAGAFFFQSGSKTGILQAIGRVLSNPRAAREKAAEILPILQARHSWKTTAERTLAAYASIYSHEDREEQAKT